MQTVHFHICSDIVCLRLRAMMPLVLDSHEVSKGRPTESLTGRWAKDGCDESTKASLKERRHRTETSRMQQALKYSGVACAYRFGTTQISSTATRYAAKACIHSHQFNRSNCMVLWKSSRIHAQIDVCWQCHALMSVRKLGVTHVHMGMGGPVHMPYKVGYLHAAIATAVEHFANRHGSSVR